MGRVTAISSAGWQQCSTAAEDRQKNSARGQLEEDPGDPEGHGGSASAARRQGQCSSERGEARFLSALRQFGTSTTRPA